MVSVRVSYAKFMIWGISFLATQDVTPEFVANIKRER